MKTVYRNLIILCLFFITLMAVWYLGNLKNYISITTIKNNQQFLHDTVLEMPLMSHAVYMLIFFIGAVSGLPITVALITLGGFLFGTLTGGICSLIVLILSSMATWHVSKKLFGNALQKKYAHRLRTFNDNVSRYGFYYLIAARTVPIIPFFFINVASGLTNIRLDLFVISTAVGSIPTVFFWAYLGSQCANLIVNC